MFFDCATWFICTTWTNRMHYFLLIYFSSKPYMFRAGLLLIITRINSIKTAIGIVMCYVYRPLAGTGLNCQRPVNINSWIYRLQWAGELSLYSDWATDWRSGIESRWERDFPPIHTGPGAKPASCKMGTGSFTGVKCGRGVLLNIHRFLVPWVRKSTAITLPIIWATLGL